MGADGTFLGVGAFVAEEESEWEAHTRMRDETAKEETPLRGVIGQRLLLLELVLLSVIEEPLKLGLNQENADGEDCHCWCRPFLSHRHR